MSASQPQASEQQIVQRLRQQLPLCGLTPTVAIGGISLERAAAVQACGVGGVALVSAITAAPDWPLACRQLLAQLGNGGEVSPEMATVQQLAAQEGHHAYLD